MIFSYKQTPHLQRLKNSNSFKTDFELWLDLSTSCDFGAF